MADNEKQKVNRYPLGDVPQCKRTVARLVRDVLNGRLDMGKARAAAYVIRQLVQLFKLEMPERKEVTVNRLKADITLLTPAERNRRIAELEKEMFPFVGEYEEYKNFAGQQKAENRLREIREGSDRTQRAILEGKLNRGEISPEDFERQTAGIMLDTLLPVKDTADNSEIISLNLRENSEGETSKGVTASMPLKTEWHSAGIGTRR